MKTSLTSSPYFPEELQNYIFAELLDIPLENSIISKKIHELIFTKILKDLKLPLPENASPFLEVMNHLKERCKFFLSKVPNFVSEECKTIIEMKNQVDGELAKSYDCPELVSGKLPLLGQLWCRFLNQIDPLTPDKKLAYHLRPQPNPNFNDALSKEPNQDIQFFVRAGACKARFYPDVLSSIIKQTWCSPETVNLLLDYGFEVTMHAIISAAQSERFKEVLPRLFQSLKPEIKFTLNQICQSIPPQYYPLLENYIDKAYIQSSISDIAVLIENKFSEETILKMIEKLRGQIEPQSARLIINLAVEHRYSRDLLAALITKIAKEGRPHCLEELLRIGYYPDLIDQFLVRDQVAFNPWIFFSPSSIKIIISSDYEEEILSKIVDHIDSVSESDIELAKERGYSSRLIEKMQRIQML